MFSQTLPRLLVAANYSSLSNEHFPTIDDTAPGCAIPRDLAKRAQGHPRGPNRQTIRVMLGLDLTRSTTPVHSWHTSTTTSRPSQSRSCCLTLLNHTMSTFVIR